MNSDSLLYYDHIGVGRRIKEVRRLMRPPSKRELAKLGEELAMLLKERRRIDKEGRELAKQM